MAELDGFRDAMREELEGRAESFGRQAIERWAEEAEAHLRNATPPATASQDEWDMEPIIESREIRQRRTAGGQFAPGYVLEYTAETDDGIPLADIFEFGAKPHDIEGDPWLHWTDPETGEDVFRRRVRHPGIPATAFVRLGRRRLELAIERGDIEEATI